MIQPQMGLKSLDFVRGLRYTKAGFHVLIFYIQVFNKRNLVVLGKFGNLDYFK
jgi:hypothetical protein